MQNLDSRLQKLEATNRRYQTILLFTVASFAIIFMAFKKPQSVPDVLQAKKFEVVDDYGNILAIISQDDGKGVIKTYNKEGKKLVNVTYTTNNEGYLGIENGKGTETIRFSSSNEGGGGYIGIYNPSGKRTLTLYNDNGGGNVSVSNSNGDTRASLECNTIGGGFLGIYNASGNSAIKLTQTTSGNGDLYINSNSGEERVRLSVSSSAGNFQIKNTNKTMIVELGGTNNGNGTINTYNTSGSFIQGIGSSN
jgi:hypothetical protein